MYSSISLRIGSKLTDKGEGISFSNGQRSGRLLSHNHSMTGNRGASGTLDSLVDVAECQAVSTEDHTGSFATCGNSRSRYSLISRRRKWPEGCVVLGSLGSSATRSNAAKPA